MWNTFIYENNAYIIKYVKDSTCYKIMLSDMVNIWVEELTVAQIVERCKALNPCLDTDDQVYIDTILSIIENIESHSDIRLIKSDNQVTLECNKANTTEISSIKFDFSLKLSNAESFCKEITIPMIHTIQLLEKRQKQLCSLLEKKDAEIAQHEYENGKLKRESVVTQKFDRNNFSQKSSNDLCCNLFSKSDEFNKILIAKYGCSEPELLTVKKEESKLNKNKIPLSKRILKHKKIKLNTNVKTIKEEQE